MILSSAATGERLPSGMRRRGINLNGRLTIVCFQCKGTVLGLFTEAVAVYERTDLRQITSIFLEKAKASLSNLRGSVAQQQTKQTKQK
jgi:hypothetical protein